MSSSVLMLSENVFSSSLNALIHHCQCKGSVFEYFALSCCAFSAALLPCHLSGAASPARCVASAVRVREEVVNGVCAVLDVGDTLVPGRSRREDPEVPSHVFSLLWGRY